MRNDQPDCSESEGTRVAWLKFDDEKERDTGCHAQQNQCQPHRMPSRNVDMLPPIH